MVLYVSVGFVMLAQLLATALRPSESAFFFMSWTLPLLPFIEFTHSSPSLARLLATPGSEGATVSWDNTTAIADVPSFPWLPVDLPLPGFEDWYGQEAKHYSAPEDPLRVSNLDDPLLPALRDVLRDALRGVDIRHFVLVKIEATCKNVFPVKKGGFIWDKLSRSFKSKSLPAGARQRLATLTSTANLLTGDYDDGFDHEERRRRGGLNFNNAHTSSTYTLKSLTGTICGLTPLIADFNLELSNHIYQPCLPHIFEAFNALAHNDSAGAGAGDDFTTFKWKTSFMQSVTNTFDKQGPLMPTMGFPKDRIITKEYLKSASAKFGPANLSDINYFGLPKGEEYVSLTDEKDLEASGSLSASEGRAARDLMRNYEGQSLIRPQRLFPKEKGQGSWQFSLINPGGAMLAVRDARRPDWRLIVPVVDNVEWRFTNLASSPHETNVTVAFDFNTLYRKLHRAHGLEAAKWASEAAVVTSWQVEENARRWRYKQP